ncbi:MAG: hypothetical protein IJR99_05175 [Kiritimatiellae bacterium]|nr:hypothetical protein [Kiritimatiellia bacterium]
MNDSPVNEIQKQKQIQQSNDKRLVRRIVLTFVVLTLVIFLAFGFLLRGYLKSADNVNGLHAAYETRLTELRQELVQQRNTYEQKIASDIDLHHRQTEALERQASELIANLQRQHSNALAECGTQIEDLRLENNRQRDNARARLNRFAEKFSVMEENLRGYEQTIENQEARLAAQEKQIGSWNFLSNQVTEARRNLVELQKSTLESNDALARTKQEQADLSAAIEKLKVEKAEWEKQTRDAQAQTENVKKSLDDLRREERELLQKVDQLRNEVKRIQDNQLIPPVTPVVPPKVP